MMAWPTNPRPAKSLATLRDQLNKSFPKRSKASDGLIGDTAHAATASDHNPNTAGVVTAMDITHSPKNGLDAHKLADYMLKHRHPELKYIISNGRIAGAWSGWKWQEYAGSNPHSTHIHISVGKGDDGYSAKPYDSTRKWAINYMEEDMIGDVFKKLKPLSEGNVQFEFLKAGHQWKLDTLASGKAKASATVKKGHKITCQAYVDLTYKGKKYRYYVTATDLKNGRLYGVNRADVKIIKKFK